MKKVFVLLIVLLLMCSSSLAEGVTVEQLQGIALDPPLELTELIGDLDYTALLNSADINWEAGYGDAFVTCVDPSIYLSEC